MKYSIQLIMFSESKQVNKVPHILYIKEKTMDSIKLVLNITNYNNMSSYNNENKTTLETS